VPGREAGFALLIVLWSLSLLALLGSTVTSAGRSETRLAANLVRSAAVEAAADGGIAVGAFHLLDGSAQGWAADGTSHQVKIGDCEVTIAVHDQRGKIDPNETPPGLFAALLRQLGADAGTAQNLADAITDWRSVNDAGLEPVYRAQGRFYTPPHEAFQSLDELSLVAYMNPQLMAALLPHVSLYIEQTPTPALADPLVVAAIKDATGRNQMLANPDDQPGPLVVVLTATARSRSASFTRRAVVRLSGTGMQPYQILEWQEN
jgi:general secretion pathway protein K